MRNITFRPMREADIPAIVDIEHEVFSSPWSYSMFESELSRPKYSQVRRCSIRRYNSRLWRHVASYKTKTHITNIAVIPSMRRKGIGKDILYHMMDIAIDEECDKLIDLEVRRSNYPAQSLYRSMGFKVIYVRGKYYEDNSEDAFIMTKY